MDADGLGWRIVTLGLPVALVCASVPLLAAAIVLAAFSPDQALSWAVASAGAALWGLGVAWGLVAARVAPGLRPA